MNLSNGKLIIKSDISGMCFALSDNPMEAGVDANIDGMRVFVNIKVITRLYEGFKYYYEGRYGAESFDDYMKEIFKINKS